MAHVDERAYVNRFINGKACFIALNGTHMTSETSMQLVEIWDLGDKHELEVMEIHYKKAKAAQFIYDQQREPRIMHGPDLYHVYLQDKLQGSIWQPMLLENSIEIVEILNGHQKTSLHKVDKNANTALKQELMDAMAKKFAQRVTLKENSTRRKFTITL